VHRLRRNRGHTYVHIKDARNYDFNGTRITQALFRVEVGAAGVATVVGHGSDARASLFAVAVAASALAAVVTYRYINVSAVGALPDMHEPTWAVSGKHLSAFAVAIATGASPSRPHQPERTSPAEFRQQRKRKTTPPAASAD